MDIEPINPIQELTGGANVKATRAAVVSWLYSMAGRLVG